MSEQNKKPLLSSDTKPPGRTLLPADITQEELWWLYHNHATFRLFADKLVTEAEMAWQRHEAWQRKLS